METILLIIVGILGLIAIAQAVRVFEITSAIKGSDDDVNVTDKDNRLQGLLLLLFLFLFFGSILWMMIDYDEIMLPVAASEHGVKIDNLWAISMGIILLAFVVTQPLLFGFSYLFRGSKKRKAVYMEHNNKLELFWTGIPAVILAGLILYGLSTWSEVMNPDPASEPMVVEVYAKQFGWEFRYAGEDNELGYANVGFIEGANTLGVDPDDINALDDIITTELHLPQNRPVMLKFRSQDVIHSAYLPHFRVQMNVVPGTDTWFQFTPTVTTAEMRAKPEVINKVENINQMREARGDDPWEFDYVLLCNKICGAAHYNMQRPVYVVTEAEFQNWLEEQKVFAETL